MIRRPPRSTLFAEDILRAVALGQFGCLDDLAAARLGLGKIEMDGLFFRRNFNSLHPLKFFDSALHLLGFGRLLAEAVDERLELLHLILMIAITGLELTAELISLGKKFFVVSGLEVDLLDPEFS